MTKYQYPTHGQSCSLPPMRTALRVCPKTVFVCRPGWLQSQVCLPLSPEFGIKSMPSYLQPFTNCPSLGYLTVVLLWLRTLKQEPWLAPASVWRCLEDRLLLSRGLRWEQSSLVVRVGRGCVLPPGLMHRLQTSHRVSGERPRFKLPDSQD